MLRCESVSVHYGEPTNPTKVLDGFDLEVVQGPVAVMGPSGSGKSSLLRCISGLQLPTRGRVTVDEIPIVGGGDPRVSLVFQDHRLVEFLSVAQNLSLAAELRSQPLSETNLDDLLASVDLAGYQNRMPATLSGGQAQRVAIARALSAGGRVLLADEPTGALDGRNSRRVAELLARLAQERNILIIVATHDRQVASIMHHVVHLEDRDAQLSEAPG